MEHLKGLARLEMLDLCDTKVGDAGLEHLKGLPNSGRCGSSTPKSRTPGWNTSRE